MSNSSNRLVNSQRILHADPALDLPIYLNGVVYEAFLQSIATKNKPGPNLIRVMGHKRTGNMVVFSFANLKDRLSFKLLLTNSIGLNESNFSPPARLHNPSVQADRVEIRFLIVGLDPKITYYTDAENKPHVFQKIFKFLRDYYCQDPNSVSNAIFTNRNVRVTEYSYIYSTFICYTQQAADYIFNDPNPTDGLSNWSCYRYPPMPTCGRCCSLSHLTNDCPPMTELVCAKCAGAHNLADGCSNFVWKCINCSTNPELAEYSRHQARATFCRSKIQRIINAHTHSTNMEL